MALWVFHRLRPGAVVRLPVTKYSAFCNGSLALQPFEDGTIHLAEVGVTLIDRRFSEVWMVGYHRVFVDRHGFHTEALRRESMSGLMPGDDEALAYAGGKGRPPNVVWAAGRFESNKFRWKPGRNDIDSLKAAIRKAAHLSHDASV